MNTGLPRPVRALNAAGPRLGNLGSLGRLDAAEMLDDARRRTGLSDLGPHTDEAYRRLVASLDGEAQLSTLGRVVFSRMLRTFLAQRLRVVETLRRRPDLAAAPVARPLFVVGYWRTGTTLLHNLLAQAEHARPLLMHETVDPIPPVLRGGRRDTRPLQFGLQQRGISYLAPDLARIHDFNAGPAECLRLLGRSFTSYLFPHMVDTPSYERWLGDLSPDAFTASYELHRMQLQTLQADGRPGHWVLKSPVHLNTLEALLKVYPDAAVVQTHRDPTKVLGSLSSLAAQGVGVLARQPDPAAVGRQALERTVRTFERMDRARAVVGSDRILDVRYTDLLRDPIAVVQRIHQRFGYPLTPASEVRMRGWLAANPQGKHGAHRYSLQQFGLDPAVVEQRVAGPYRERFGLSPER